MYAYDLPQEFLKSLELMYFDDSGEVELSPEPVKSATPQPISTKECSACGISLDGMPVPEVRLHYKTDWHKYNLKQSLNNRESVTEAEFDTIAETQSISGSEDEDDDVEESVVSHLKTQSPFVLFKGDKVYGVYKASFSDSQLESPLESLSKMNRSGMSAMFMIGGGHFAGAIVSHKQKSTKGNTAKKGESLLEQSVDIVVHKTFHRYTTRRKQGGSQSAMDNAKGKANSAGSTLRRYNEAQLANDVRALLLQWKVHLDKCDAVYIRANGAANRNVLIGYEGAPLASNDHRIRSFPFTTRRPTTSELKRCWVMLTQLKTGLTLPEKKVAKPVSRPVTPVVKEEKKVVPQEQVHTTELISLLKKSRAPALIAYLKKHKLSVDTPLEPLETYANTPTLLHYASYHGLKNMVVILLNNLKADPTLANKFGKTAWELADGDKVRYSFQIARSTLGETLDWEKAKVGEPLTRDQVEDIVQGKEKQAEEEEKDFLQKEKERIKQEEENDAEEKRKQRREDILAKPGQALSNLTQTLNSMTLEQRRRFEREQRARAAEARFRAQTGGTK